MFTAVTVPTNPYDDQKPGTSGLRKNVKIFQQKNYTENFIASLLIGGLGDKRRGARLVVGGDGRYYGKEVTAMVIKICAANRLKQLIIGRNGILSTPAISHLIRKYETDGGIILTASHNPGGPDKDFGIKFNMANGGPAVESVTNAIYDVSKSLSSYEIVPNLNVDISNTSTQTFNIEDTDITIDVIDPTHNYVEYMKEIFDFNAIRSLVGGPDPAFTIQLNAMNGVMGPYVERILDELNAPKTSAVKCMPLPDFGGSHPDPNLTYASDLVDSLRGSDIDFGAAFDGDGDRNMILGKNAFFITPSDSLAIISEYLDCIPYFQKYGVKGFARSMPTAAAVDRVARAKGKEMFEVPTGWKFFGNLMDAGRLSLCGEESFGTGSDHIREKDGMWAVLAWLSVLAHKKMSVEELMFSYWSKYGRNFFTRYDYEGCDAEPCNAMMTHLENFISDPNTVGRMFESQGKTYQITKADNFQYTDPIDGSFTYKQGIRLLLTDNSRIILRLSGTGSSGATVRLYIETYESLPHLYSLSAEEMLQPLIQIALQISQLCQFTGRDAPTVIT